MTNTRKPKLRLVTIPASPYCEKARWALDRVGAEYVEEGHAALLHWAASVPRGSRTVPLLLSPHGKVKDSTDILKFVDRWVREEDRLFPHDADQFREVQRLENLFDEKLGKRARRWAYAWLVDDRAGFAHVMGQKLNRAERAIFEPMQPALIGFLRRAFKVNHPAAQTETFEKVKRTIEDLGLEELYADGRRYLVGDRFTAADLTLAAMGAVLVFPEEFGGMSGVGLVPLERVAPGLRAQVDAFRATRTGAAILRLYREERRVRISMT